MGHGMPSTFTEDRPDGDEVPIITITLFTCDLVDFLQYGFTLFTVKSLDIRLSSLFYIFDIIGPSWFWNTVSMLSLVGLCLRYGWLHFCQDTSIHKRLLRWYNSTKIKHCPGEFKFHNDCGLLPKTRTPSKDIVEPRRSKTNRTEWPMNTKWMNSSALVLSPGLLCVYVCAISK